MIQIGRVTVNRKRVVTSVILLLFSFVFTFPGYAGTSPLPLPPLRFLTNEIDAVEAAQSLLDDYVLTNNDLSQLPNGRFEVRIPIENGDQKLRLVVTGGNPNDVIEFVNSAQIFFTAAPLFAGDPDNFANGPGIDIDPSDDVNLPDPIINQFQNSDPLQIELALVTGGNDNNVTDAYVTYFYIDPPIHRNDVHSYRAVEATSISVTGSILSGSQLDFGLLRDYDNAILAASTELTFANPLHTYKDSVSSRGGVLSSAEYSALFTAQVEGIYEIYGGFSADELCDEDDEACIRVEFPPPVEPRLTTCRNVLNDTWFTQGGDNSVTQTASGYVMSINDPTGTSEFPAIWGSLQQQSFTDHHITADILVPEVTSNNGIASTGIWFRYQDGSNYLAFMFTTGGEYRIARYKDRTYTDIDNSNQPWTKHSAINREAGRSNRLEIISEGSQYDFYINGTQVASLNNNDWSSGRVAFYGSVERDAAPATFTLANIEICS